MAMTGWVKVDDKLWTDEKFLGLSADAKVLFIWSWQPPHSAVCGLFNVDLEEMCEALAPDATIVRVQAALEELMRAGMIVYDPEPGVLWVVNRVKYAPKSPKAIKLMKNELAQVKPSFLVEKFMERHASEFRRSSQK
jgi:hypothetical protein